MKTSQVNTSLPILSWRGEVPYEPLFVGSVSVSKLGLLSSDDSAVVAFQFLLLLKPEPKTTHLIVIGLPFSLHSMADQQSIITATTCL